MTAADLARAWPELTLTAVAVAALGPARDQGPRDTCLALAATVAHEARRADGVGLSGEYLFWGAKQRDGLPAASYTTVRAVCGALRDRGQPADAAWPYDPARDDRSPAYVPPAAVGRLYTQPTATLAPTLAAVEGALAAGTAPMLLIAPTEMFFTPVAGRVAVRAPGGAPDVPVTGLLHAVTAVACGHTAQGHASVVVRNSWGPDWGVQGYGLLGGAYVTAHLRAVVGVA